MTLLQLIEVALEIGILAAIGYLGIAIYHCYLLTQLQRSLERTEGVLRTIAVVLSMREGQLSDRQLMALFKIKQGEEPKPEEEGFKTKIHFPKEPRE